MKNILAIMRHDLRKITGSVVAIVTIIGLCIVPCSYAWFNILSNWSPYESDATGRISVAVASEDKGAEVAGLTINVGSTIVEALEANDDIGWVFVDTGEEAINGVYAGDYYAALVVPENFTSDVMSFTYGNLINPKLKYYENEKKNAIAPKITGKAKTAVQEEVNATFVETLAKYVSDAASVAEASGTNPEDILDNMSARTDELARSIDSCVALSDSASGLTGAAGTLLDTSGVFMGSAQDVLSVNDDLLEEICKSIPEHEAASTETKKTASDYASDADSAIGSLKSEIAVLAASTTPVFNTFVTKDRDKWVQRVNALQQDAITNENALRQAGHTVLAEEFYQLEIKLGEISEDLTSLNTEMTWSERVAALKELASDIEDAENLINVIRDQIRTDIDNDLANALTESRNSVTALRAALSSANSDLGKLSVQLGQFGGSLATLKVAVDNTTANLRDIRSGASEISGILSGTAGNELLSELSEFLANDETAVANYLADPIDMDTEVIWPVENYGSSMAPFYTVLAQWVGALLTAVLIKVKLRKKGELENLKLREWFFGRFGLYVLVGIAQALIVSVGDLLYVGIQCVAPGRFILAACVNGIVFMMINYALVFALDNIGQGAAVIILVLQVAGAGGTYPIEVLPDIFKILYPLMPFRYAMDAMRECIAGMYGNTYWKCLGILFIFYCFAVAFGLAFYKPALRLNEMIRTSKAESEIML